MLRSLANFFQCANKHDTPSTFIFPAKLLEEVNAEILYRQKFFIMCTLLTSVATIGGTLGGILFLFKKLQHKVSELSYDTIDFEDSESVLDYYGYKASFYGFLPLSSLLILYGEIKYFFSGLKNYYHYAENTPVSDLSPALFEKVKDYLKTIQYQPDYLTIEDLQEILLQESNRNSINETRGVYYTF